MNGEQLNQVSARLDVLSAAVGTIGGMLLLLVERSKFDRKEAAQDLTAHLAELQIEFGDTWERLAREHGAPGEKGK